MAKTLQKVIDSIKVDLKVFSDDDLLSDLDEFIADKCHSIRESLIREEFEQKKFVDDKYYQFSNCIEVVCERNTCVLNGLTITMPFVIWKANLGKLMSGVAFNDIKYLGTGDFSQPFSRLSFESFALADGSGIYTANEPSFTIVGETALLKNLDEKTRLLWGVLLHSNPLDSCSYSQAQAYPVPSEYKLELLVKMDILKSWNIPTDVLNDARGAITQPQRKDDQEDKGKAD
jgi:hypothetical protein